VDAARRERMAHQNDQRFKKKENFFLSQKEIYAMQYWAIDRKKINSTGVVKQWIITSSTH